MRAHGRRFRDRTDAGTRLAERLGHLAGSGPLVLGLPRGGVVVAAAVATALDAPLDVLVVRKLGAPWQEELAIGAIAAGTEVLDNGLVDRLRVTPAQLDRLRRRERAELVRREAAYRAGRGPLLLGGRVVVVVDDGLATGATAQAALQVVRAAGPARLVLAVPVAPVGAADRLTTAGGGPADEVVCLLTPSSFGAVSVFYDDFRQTTDVEVLELLATHQAHT